MNFLASLISFWHQLPLPVSAAICALISFVGGDLLNYLSSTQPSLLTWQGVGAAVVAGIVTWGEGYMRLIQAPPEK